MADKKNIQKNEGLFERVAVILEEARTQVIRTVNNRMVIAYWLIGREIVEAEQEGEARAGYGKRLIEDLSGKLSRRYGKGFSTTNLRYFRQFYLAYGDRTVEIRHLPGGELSEGERRNGEEKDLPEKSHLPGGEFTDRGFHPDLSWSHYRALMRVENKEARSFYEIETIRNRWPKEHLERQIHSLLFERLLKSRDRDGLLRLASEGNRIEKPQDVLKDPYILEFLGLPESHLLMENELEQALISHLREFLLELGSGFAFVGRQVRLTLEGDHFYPDLVFYHIKLKCYVIIDLKVAKLTPADLGQMQMYVHYYDREVAGPDDNPSIGLLLCTDKNEAVVQYILDEANQQIFASRYRLELPSEEELRRELARERILIEKSSKRQS